MPRIAVDARPLSHGPNGIARYLRAKLERLVNLDSQIEWFLYSDRPLQSLSSVTDSLTKNRVRIRHGMNRRSATSSVYAQTLFPWWARKDKIDLYWSPRHHLPLMYPTLVGRKSLVTIHDMVWCKSGQTMKTGGLTLERLLMPPAIRMADHIIVPSQATADDVAEFNQQATDKISVIPLASNIFPQGQRGVIDTKHQPTQDYLLMVANLEPRKNMCRVVNAFKQAKPKLPKGFKLKIAGGRGWHSDELINLLEDSRSFDVEYLDVVDDEQLTLLYSGCRGVMLPSLYEGFGLSLVEAFAFGKPVITANLSSLPEVAGDAGLLVNPYDTAEITQAILNLCLDEQLYEKLSRQATLRHKLFSWEKAATQTYKVIKQLL